MLYAFLIFIGFLVGGLMSFVAYVLIFAGYCADCRDHRSEELRIFYHKMAMPQVANENKPQE